MVPASVVKVQVALEAETSFVEGRLDPCERVTLSAADRTPGPVGMSLFNGDAVLSWRDVVVLMLIISDNHTTDALLRRVGVDALIATAMRLGLTGTAIESDLRTMLDSIGQDGSVTRMPPAGRRVECPARRTSTSTCSCSKSRWKSANA
ncbi:serine hydrolase [Streptomyces sp. MC1]|uniref:serine hydrolase n=1 Tax=Streptomyces sp. MC1 TaxID=295105 RepID=UPI0035A8BD78